jgi:3-dehydroquinate dehydratase
MATTALTLRSMAKRASIQCMKEYLSDRVFPFMTQKEHMNVISEIEDVFRVIGKDTSEGKDASDLMELLLSKPLSDEEGIHALRVVINLKEPHWTMGFLTKFGSKLPVQEYVDAVHGIIEQDDLSWIGRFLAKFGSKLPVEEYVDVSRRIIKKNCQFQGELSQVFLFWTKTFFLARFGSKLPDREFLDVVHMAIDLDDKWDLRFLDKIASELPNQKLLDVVRTDVVRTIIKQGNPRAISAVLESSHSKLLPDEEYIDAVRWLIEHCVKHENLSYLLVDVLPKFGSKLPKEEYVATFRRLIEDSNKHKDGPDYIEIILSKFDLELPDQEYADLVRRLIEYGHKHNVWGYIERILRKFGSKLSVQGFVDAVNKWISQHRVLKMKEEVLATLRDFSEKSDSELSDVNWMDAVREIIKQKVPFLTWIFLERFGSKLPESEFVAAIQGIIEQEDLEWTPIFLEKFGSKLPRVEFVDAIRRMIKRNDELSQAHFYLSKFGPELSNEECVATLREIIEDSWKKWERIEMSYLPPPRWEDSPQLRAQNNQRNVRDHPDDLHHLFNHVTFLSKFDSLLPAEEYMAALRRTLNRIIDLIKSCGSHDRRKMIDVLHHWKLPAEKYVDVFHAVQKDLPCAMLFLEQFGSKLPDEEYVDALCKIAERLRHEKPDVVYV